MNALKSEFTKLASVRSTLIYAILLTGALYGPVVLKGLLDQPSDTPTGWSDLLLGAPIFQMIVIIMAASFTGGEIKNRMNAQAFLTQSHRMNWLVAKMIVLAFYTLGTLLLGVALAVGAASVLGVNMGFGLEQQYLTTSLVTFPLLVMAAVGITALLRSQVAGIALPILLMLVVEPLLQTAANSISVLRPLAAIMPNSILTNLSYGVDVHPHAASGSAAVLVLVGWLIATVAAGLWSNATRDVQ
ncbi:MAG TPA: ABC transporter permease [Candidatus Corynebacterium gallistercoris]|uniref:ABC transporter permease n=1 Tax=Candidatus Corynebacterium gallistercoris TaxID=2838530 RepID=A0A9D1RXB5_9CORY|nr:ABC transporter permease [Candidatus Corynebacterium gallistercoris]